MDGAPRPTFSETVRITLTPWAGDDSLIPPNADAPSAGATEVDGSPLWLMRGDEVAACLEGDVCVEAEPVAPDPVARTGVRLIWSKGGNSCRVASDSAVLVNGSYAEEEDDGSRERAWESETEARDEHDTDRSRSVRRQVCQAPKYPLGW
jgi:hypothetical protein